MRPGVLIAKKIGATSWRGGEGDNMETRMAVER